MGVATVRLATPEDVAIVAASMRAEDIAEVRAGSGDTPAQALDKCFRWSTEAYTGEIDGAPVMMFGVAVASILSGHAVPWALTTYGVEQNKVAFLRKSRIVVNHWLTEYSILSNYVDAEYTSAVHWLRWLGFTIEPAHPYGGRGAMFHYFHKTKA